MNRASTILAVMLFVTGLLLVGCGGGNKQAAAPQKIPVKAMKVQQQSVPVVYGFPGQVVDKEEVQVHSKISGAIVEKYIKGGERVRAGDLIYKVDSRQYETAVNSAQADLRKAESNYRRYKTDLERNERLYEAEVISQQTLINSRADFDSYAANLESAQAALRKAQENLADTSVYAPMDGRAALDDVAVGTYAMAGSTTLVTIGTIDPIYVLYSISETEYLDIVAKAMTYRDNPSKDIPRFTTSIILSNGEQYQYNGEPVEVDRSLAKNSGSVNVKAIFPNPDGVLLPGMFAQVRITKELGRNTLLVPQRAVQQLLDKTFVLVVGEDGKSLSKTVELDEKVGSYFIVKSGLNVNDLVIVEGLTNLQSGKDLAVTTVTAEEMGFTTKNATDLVNES